MQLAGHVFTAFSVVSTAAAAFADEKGLLNPEAAALLVVVIVLGFAGIMAKQMIDSSNQTRIAVERMDARLFAKGGLHDEVSLVRERTHNYVKASASALALAEAHEPRISDLEKRELARLEAAAHHHHKED